METIEKFAVIRRCLLAAMGFSLAMTSTMVMADQNVAEEANYLSAQTTSVSEAGEEPVAPQRTMPPNVQSGTLPSSTTSDWSTLLDPSWKCGSVTGPRWDQWKKSVLLFAATSGFSFKGTCKVTIPGYYDPRINAALIVFRDRNKVPQYVAWYDTQLDNANNSVFGGITPLTAEIRYDVRTPYYKNYPLHLYTPQQMSEYYAEMGKIMDVMDPDYDYWRYREVLELSFTSIDRLKGCKPPYWQCGTGEITFRVNGGEGRLDISVFPEEVYGSTDSGVVAGLYISPDMDLEWYEKLVMATLAVGWTMMGAGIGEYIGLVSGTAESAAFAAGFGGFTTSLIQGNDVGQSLINGLKGAGLAYTGKLILNAYGDPDSLVGVSGAGCPTGDQCWYFQMANGFPPLKHLAELHDPFINWSVKAFPTIGQNAWYKAVTIAPFVVPGCLASAPCVTGGITIVKDDEIN